MILVLLVIYLGTTVWVGIDAHYAGRDKYSVFYWVLFVLFLWIVGMPWYLVDRRRFEQT